jgi:hypothetical protein
MTTLFRGDPPRFLAYAADPRLQPRAAAPT